MQELESRRRELERKRKIFEARMIMLRAEFEGEEEVVQRSISESELLGEELLQDRGQMVRSRKADPSSYKKEGRAQVARTSIARGAGSEMQSILASILCLQPAIFIWNTSCARHGPKL